MGLVFNVRRSEPELVKPAKATPNGVKSLSDWDDRVSLRYWMSGITFYDSSAASKMTRDPAETIKTALAEALVYYYPVAGRFKEQGSEKRLVVDCTGEGVGFVSADADVKLDQFGVIQPPFPCLKELLYYNKPTDSTMTLSCPIFVIQVTRLVCGGFIVTFAMNHVMSDLLGAAQIIFAISELARGATAPSILPVWRRELLNARVGSQARAMSVLPSKSDAVVPLTTPSNARVISNKSPIIYRSFFFGRRELKAIRARLPQFPGDRFSSFDLISACIFHCRVVSLDHSPNEKVCAIVIVSAWTKLMNPPLPLGFYGNSSVTSAILSTMENFHDFQYVLEEVKRAKDSVTEEYVRSLVEEAVMERLSGIPKSAPNCPTYIISDLSKLGFSALDFGGGGPVYAGHTSEIDFARPDSYMVAATNNEGEDGRLITLYMPKDEMDKFDLTLRKFLCKLSKI